MINISASLTFIFIQIIYTVSKGPHSMFYTMNHLGSLVHVTEAEVNDAVAVCTELMQTYGRIACLPVDNAARHVAQATKDMLNNEHGQKVLTLRDMAHCLDLLSKNMSSVSFVIEVLEDSKPIQKLLSNDRVASIIDEAVRDGLLPAVGKVQSVVDTRMNTLHDHLKSVRAHAVTLKTLHQLPKFREYLRTRTPNARNEIEQLLRRCNVFLWGMMDLVIAFTRNFKEAHLICARRDNPLSSWYLIVQALRNGLNDNIGADDGLFDRILGHGSSREVANIMRPRFNMNGADPAGSIVGLLDEFHLWALLIDPFGWEWRGTLALAGSIPTLVNNMIEHFVSLDDDGTDGMRRIVKHDYEVCISCYYLLYIISYAL